MQPEDRYSAWLTAREPGLSGKEDPSLEIGGFRFFAVEMPRGKRLEAAASSLTLVAKDGTGNWASFLRSGPPDAIAQRVAWLQGSPSLLTPASRMLESLEKKSPGIAQAVTRAQVKDDGDHVRLDAWYVFQPGSQVSHLVIDARTDGANLTWTPYAR